MKSINATHYESIPAWPPSRKKEDRIVHAVIETPQNSTYKYALEPTLGIIELKAMLPNGMSWPYDYGFIPQTLGDDGDPFDLLMLLEEPSFSGCLVKARLLGAVMLTKDGIRNDRYIAAAQPMPGRSQATDNYHDLSDIPGSEMRKIERFLHDYSEREGNDIVLLGHLGATDALEAIARSTKRFRKTRAA